MRIQWLALVSVVAVVSACRDVVAPAPESSPQLAIMEGVDFQPGEEEFRRIRAKEPGFAGYFYEDSILVVLVKEGRRSEAVRDATLAEMAISQSRGRDLNGLFESVETRPVAFSFAELSDWRDQVLAQGLFDIPGVEWIDLDEAMNRVTIATSSSVADAAVTDRLANLRLPAGALGLSVSAGLCGREQSPQGFRPRTRSYSGSDRYRAA